MSKLTRVVFAALALLLPAAAQSATPRDTLVIARNLDALITFDPAQLGEVTGIDILRNVCDPLVAYDPKGGSKIVPATAEHWTLSPDGLTLTFMLRPDLRFPSGKRATAHDAAWSMQRAVRLGLFTSVSLTEWGFTRENIATQIRATDDRTVVVAMDRAYPAGLILSAAFTSRATYILDREEGTKHANTVEGRSDEGNAFFRTNPICVGPYKLTRWNANEVVVLERNDLYHGAAPNLRRVILRHVPESGAQRLLLEQGDIDVAQSLNAADLHGLATSRTIRIEQTEMHGTTHLAFNVSDPILRHAKVRHAFRYLIDYDGVGRTIMEYWGVPRASLVPLGAFGALDKKAGQPFRLDLSRAKQLITEAGYPNGFSKKLILSASDFYPLLAQHVQANAAKIGVTLELEQMAEANLFTRWSARDFQVLLSGNIVAIPDAVAMVSRHAVNLDNRPEAKLTGNTAWRSSWQDLKINAMADDAMMERDPAKRVAKYHAIQRYMLENGPLVYITQRVRSIAVRNEVKGFVITPFHIAYGTASK